MEDSVVNLKSKKGYKHVADLTIYQKIYDLTLWFFPNLNKLPRSERVILGAEIKGSLLRLLRKVIESHNSKDKLPILYQASAELDILRALVRITVDLKYLSIKQYEFASKNIAEIGRMIGGWIVASQTVK